MRNSNEKAVRNHQHCISAIITPIQIVAKPTEAWDTALLYLSLANPVLKPGGL